MDDSLLTAEQLADRLGVRPRTVQEWSRAGMIPVIRLTPKVIRYDLQTVVIALKQRQEALRVTRCQEVVSNDGC